MNKLILELKEEHTKCAQLLNEIKKLGPDSEEGFNLLIHAREHFKTHLKKEAEILYPVLFKAAESDFLLKNMLGEFATDIDKIKEFTENFFNKYAENLDHSELKKDFGNLFTLLSTRLRREELMIYNKYEEIINSQE
ncbi:MAG: hemerythrin domain-containing protein [Bacteroidales bacterium]|nr:hemerythrin domain-containing protein [Bacteroidales bacterium]